MNLRAPQKNEKGFTIIEVMIVLAIAGLIILIVFLAVPALQRNSRNTQRRNDAARVSGLMSEFIANNNGSLPTAIGTDPGQINLSASDLSIYSGVTLATGADNVTDVNTLQVRTGVSCDNNVMMANSARAFAIAFAVETSNGDTAQCI